MHPAPIVGTFHAAGDSVVVPHGSARRALAGRAASTCAARCRTTPGDLAQRYIGGDYEMLFNGVELDALPRAPTGQAADGPTIFFCGRHEPRKGLDVLLEAMRCLPRDVRCGWPATAPTPPRLQARLRRRPPDRVARAGSPTPRRSPGCGAPTCSAPRRSAASPSASCCSRRWRPARRSWPPTCPATATWPRRRRRACSCRPGDPQALAAALRRVLADDELAERLRAPGDAPGRAVLDGPPRPALPRALRAAACRTGGTSRRRLLERARERRRLPVRSRRRPLVARSHHDRRAHRHRRHRRPARAVSPSSRTTAWSAAATASRTPGRRSTSS